MKKLLFCMAACAVLALCMTGCSSQQTFEEGSYSSAGEEVRAVTVDVSDREVLIGASADGQVRIEYSESEKEYYDISLSEEGELTMTLVLDKQWTDFIGTKPAIEDRTIRLYLPDGLLSSLKVTTTNEAVVLSPCPLRGAWRWTATGATCALSASLSERKLPLRQRTGTLPARSWAAGMTSPSPAPSRRGRATCLKANRAGKSRLPSTATTATSQSSLYKNAAEKRRPPERFICVRGVFYARQKFAFLPALSE